MYFQTCLGISGISLNNIWVKTSKNSDMPRNNRKYLEIPSYTQKHPTVKSIPENTQSYISTLLRCFFQYPTRYWKNLIFLSEFQCPSLTLWPEIEKPYLLGTGYISTTLTFFHCCLFGRRGVVKKNLLNVIVWSVLFAVRLVQITLVFLGQRRWYNLITRCTLLLTTPHRGLHSHFTLFCCVEFKTNWNLKVLTI